MLAAVSHLRDQSCYPFFLLAASPAGDRERGESNTTLLFKARGKWRWLCQIDKNGLPNNCSLGSHLTHFGGLRLFLLMFCFDRRNFRSMFDKKKSERERHALFNEALNTFYLRLYGVRHMVKDHSDSEKGNPLPPHRLLLSINSKGSFICTIPQTG